MSDIEIDQSLLDMLTREQMIDFDNGDLLNKKRNCNRNRIEQQFSFMNRQIGEMTSIVLTLTEKIFSNIREGNGKNFLGNECRALLCGPALKKFGMSIAGYFHRFY